MAVCLDATQALHDAVSERRLYWMGKKKRPVSLVTFTSNFVQDAIPILEPTLNTELCNYKTATICCPENAAYRSLLIDWDKIPSADYLRASWYPICYRYCRP